MASETATYDPAQYKDGKDVLADKTGQVLKLLPDDVLISNSSVQVTAHQEREPTLLTLRKAGRPADLGIEGHMFHRQFLDPPVGTQPWQGDCDCGITFQDVSIRAAHVAACGVTATEAYSTEVWKAAEEATQNIEENDEADDLDMPDHFDLNLSMRTQIDPRRDRTVCGAQWRADEENVVCIPSTKKYDADETGLSRQITSLFKQPINAME